MGRFFKNQLFVKNFELILILSCAVSVALVCIYLDAFEALVAFVDRNDAWELDEYLIVLMFGGFAALALLVLRSRDLGREMARREASEVRATILARHDPLTGLPNRRVLAEELATAIASVRDRSAECAVFLIDLDLFKPVNDIHGHVTGDAVLIEVAARIRQSSATARLASRAWAATNSPASSPTRGHDLPARLAGQIVRSLGEPILIGGVRCRSAARSASPAAPQDGLRRARCSTAPISQCTRASARAAASIISSMRRWTSSCANAPRSRPLCALR